MLHNQAVLNRVLIKRHYLLKKGWIFYLLNCSIFHCRCAGVFRPLGNSTLVPEVINAVVRCMNVDTCISVWRGNAKGRCLFFRKRF